MVCRPDQFAQLNERWLWLFPASYAVHIAEEGLADERFYHWIHRVVGREIGADTFLALNLAFETAMGAAVWRARSRADSGWIVATLGTITTVNGVGVRAGLAAVRAQVAVRAVLHRAREGEQRACAGGRSSASARGRQRPPCHPGRVIQVPLGLVWRRSPDARGELRILDTWTMSQPADQPVPTPAPPGGLRVLVVDDERALADLLGSYLTRDGFDVSTARDGQDAIDQARQVDPDVMVLDLGLPVIDGVEVCRVVRTFSDCYIVMLTARTEEIDKLIGLSVGADDYLTKPFSPRELLARIHAMLRRPRATTTSGRPIREAPPRVFGALSIDVAGREAHLSGEAVALTRTEFDVLEALSARPGMVFSRRQLIDAVWDQAWVGDEHLVDVHVGHLRRKLGDDPSSPRYVRTVRGVGYRMGEGR